MKTSGHEEPSILVSSPGSPADVAFEPGTPAKYVRIGAYWLVALAIWSVIGRYWGIRHDAIAYALEAVAKFSPVPLATDIFLRYQSQADFTLFPQTYAVLIAHLGIDRAAALGTLLCLLTWFTIAGALARRLEGARLAMLSVGLLLVIPGWYSAGQVFRYAEYFLTARLPAEVLSLGALLCVLASRRVAAAILLAAAVLMHPLMAFPAVLLSVLLVLQPPDWRQWTALTLVGAVGAIVGSYMLTHSDPLMSGAWLKTTSWRVGFLFAGEWTNHDREVMALPLLTLALAAAALPVSEARRVMTGALCVSVCGLFLAVVCSEILPLKLLLQGQPWRWLWIGRFLATALLPLLIVQLWRDGRLGQTAAALVASAWLLTDFGSTGDIEPIGASGALCALALALWGLRARIGPRTVRVLQLLSWAALGCIGVAFLSVILVAARSTFSFGSDPMEVQRVIEVLRTPGIAALIVLAAWYLAAFGRRWWGPVLCTVAAGWLIANSWRETIATWTEAPFDAKKRAAFAEWRTLIPVESEVLWADYPQAAWFLLDRRSYLSVSQGGGTVYSKDATEELLRRATFLAALAKPGSWFLDPSARHDGMRRLTPSILRSVCRAPGLDFVVSTVDISDPVAVAEWPGKGDFVYLYDCRPLRDPENA